ncbi:cold-shock protein [Bradyrhizobium agreste]|uniref:cold-shock protein n=1 Tax=Bradyrhizobium agreste TaxID=2751811 RepID=UPI0035D9B888
MPQQSCLERPRLNGDVLHCEVVNATKGYGFIRPVDGEPDVFGHIRAVEKADYTVLRGPDQLRAQDGQLG